MKSFSKRELTSFHTPKVKTISKIATDCVIYFLKKFTLAVHLNHTSDCADKCIHDMSAGKQLSQFNYLIQISDIYGKRKRGDHI